MAMGTLNHFPLADLEPDSAQALHFHIDALKLTMADAERYVPILYGRAGKIDLQSRTQLIDPDRAGDFGAGAPKAGSKVNIITADASGMTASYSQSNYAGFGSGTFAFRLTRVLRSFAWRAHRLALKAILILCRISATYTLRRIVC